MQYYVCYESKVLSPCQNDQFMPQRVPNRIVIYTKDVENITGKKERAARKLLQKIRIHFSKKSSEYITVEEFAEVTGIKAEYIHDFLL